MDTSVFIFSDFRSLSMFSPVRRANLLAAFGTGEVTLTGVSSFLEESNNYTGAGSEINFIYGC
jgi:hypothetical protein